MPGLYLHIPFCKQACHYCNFHFSTSLKFKGELLAALHRELTLRRENWSFVPLSTIYLGGGTPSLLSYEELMRLFDEIYKLFEVDRDAEITLEANPDDLSPAYLQALRRTPVNRLSIGIQSFADEDLRLMNRAHNAAEARSCLKDALSAGFDDLTVDLIYGAPSTSDAQWQENVQTLVDLKVPHLSCYCLTVEPQTALHHFVKTGKAAPVDEDQANRQFEWLMQFVEDNGYEHYEISNFALPGRYSKHNTSYWLGEPYLGIGPAAHSFDGQRRWWNAANNAKYIKALSGLENAADLGRLSGDLYEEEKLTPVQQYNEYVMTGLRTKWGCNLPKIETMGAGFADYFVQGIQPFLEQGFVLQTPSQTYLLTRQGKFLADHIASELFFV